VWGWYLLLSLVSLLLLGRSLPARMRWRGAAPLGVGRSLAAAMARLHWQLLAILLWLLYTGLITMSCSCTVLGAKALLAWHGWCTQSTCGDGAAVDRGVVRTTVVRFVRCNQLAAGAGHWWRAAAS